MFEQKKCKADYSFIMAPFYLMDDDELLKSQLLNLNYQTDTLFEVIIPDPHYSKRTWLQDYVKNFKYNVSHFPYIPNLKTPKSFDYAIFNNAVLMSSSEKIITFQDWRYCHPKLIKILRQLTNFDFVGFNWQILYKDNCKGMESDGKHITPHKKSTIPLTIQDAQNMYKNGIFPDIGWNSYRENTFDNSSWGHYCINKNLWLEVNGIDEVATNTRHYADLDLYARLNELYRRKNKIIDIPVVINVMVRIMHDKGKYLGGSNIPLEFEVNESHKKCCFINTDSMNDKDFMEYVVSNIYSGKFIKLYDIPYSHDFTSHNTNKSLDMKHSTKGFQCKDCNLISETPHWYDKSPNARIKSLVNIGLGDNKLGRDLNILNGLIKNKSMLEKVNILNAF